jgi:hypothetical protein
LRAAELRKLFLRESRLSADRSQSLSIEGKVE